MPPELVSVIIPTFNGARTLPAQLDALLSQTYSGSVEVVIVDNRSTDDLADVFAAYRLRFGAECLRVVSANEQAGVNYARNVGLRASRGELVCVCDADDVVSPHWLQELVSAAETADIIGGKQDLDLLNTPARAAARPYAAADHLPVALNYRPYVSGCNLAVWRSVAMALGGWDEQYAGGADDMDFSWRAIDAGYSLAFASRAIVHYRLRETMRGMFTQGVGYGRNVDRLAAAHPAAIQHLPRTSTLVYRVVRSGVLALGVPFAPFLRYRWAYNFGLRWGNLLGRVSPTS